MSNNRPMQLIKINREMIIKIKDSLSNLSNRNQSKIMKNLSYHLIDLKNRVLNQVDLRLLKYPQPVIICNPKATRKLIQATFLEMPIKTKIKLNPKTKSMTLLKSPSFVVFRISRK